MVIPCEIKIPLTFSTKKCDQNVSSKRTLERHSWKTRCRWSEPFYFRPCSFLQHQPTTLHFVHVELHMYLDHIGMPKSSDFGTPTPIKNNNLGVSMLVVSKCWDWDWEAIRSFYWDAMASFSVVCEGVLVYTTGKISKLRLCLSKHYQTIDFASYRRFSGVD